jgi:Phosphotransferase enzyme family
MDSAHSTARENYRLIVTRSNASEILLRPHGSAWRLPSVEILPGRRIAEQLTAELYAQWGCRTYCLLVPALAAGLPHCGVMEATDLEQVSPAGTCWKPLDLATCAAVHPAEDRTVIEKSILEWAEHRRVASQAPFTKPGWLSELFAWAQEKLTPLGVRLTGSFAQLNVSPRFSLFRLETDDASAVWFKATGEPNLHELPVTLALARLFPGHVPRILGVQSAWNGWLAQEARGVLLDDCEEFSSWERAARDLAELQLSSVGKCPELLESSCKDLRLPKLIKLVDPFLARMADLMAAQTKQPPDPLTPASLAFLGERLKEACALLHELDLPETLGHVDFNPGNIVVSPAECCFLDWAEGCVSHPFLTFEYLREHVRRRFLGDAAAMERIATAYLHPWQGVCPFDTVIQAMAISPLVAVFTAAVVDQQWHSVDPLKHPRVAGYFRGLTRRMFREANEMVEGSERCRA